jgi:hypothetical protein
LKGTKYEFLKQTQTSPLPLKIPAMWSDSILSIPSEARWAAARTKSRCEKKFAEYLRVRNVPSFLPLVKRRNIGNREVRFFQIPLFSCYVFFDISAISPTAVMQSDRVVDILEPDDQQTLHTELKSLALALHADEFLMETRFKQTGNLVTIKKGPLKGLNGELVRINENMRLLIRVSFLSQAALVEIDEGFVEQELSALH